MINIFMQDTQKNRYRIDLIIPEEKLYNTV